MLVLDTGFPLALSLAPLFLINATFVFLCGGIVPLRYADRIVGKLRREGLKITPQRVAILEFLDGNKRHPSVDEIYREVSKTFQTLSLATVYNTLDTLEEIREVQTVHIDCSRKRYDPDPTPHHHLMCRRCGEIRDIHADFGSSLAVPGDLSHEFQVESTSVSFRGVCRECADSAL
jgi:Fur family peroxide stress response transcriptional regulator